MMLCRSCKQWLCVLSNYNCGVSKKLSFTCPPVYSNALKYSFAYRETHQLASSLCLLENTFCSPLVPTRRYSRKSAVAEKDDENDFEKMDSFEELFCGSDSKPDRSPAALKRKVPEKSFAFDVSNQKPIKEEENSDEPKQKTALDIALELRKEKGEKESPFQTLASKNLNPAKKATEGLSAGILNLEKLTDYELAQVLRRNVIYADKRLVLFNKPYGLPMHDGDKTSLHIKNVLPMVSKMLYGVNTNVPLTMCNRLDKFTTGVVVTTTDKDTTRLVQQRFREHKVLRKYWTVAIRAPDPISGIIDIPLDKEIIEADRPFARMSLKPEYRFDSMANKQVKVRTRGQIAITHYHTLDSGMLALIELQPMTTIKHQLRVHLADGIDCPILGDHKYSHSKKLAPQSLSYFVLRRFGIENPKTRHMPMHLHLQSLMIPNLFPDSDKPHLIVCAKPPKHMLRTMKMFHLKPGRITDWKGVEHIREKRKTAKPQNPANKDLYVDPTVAPIVDEDDGEIDLYSKSVRVMRNSRILVKYKHS